VNIGHGYDESVAARIALGIPKSGEGRISFTLQAS